MKNSLSLIVLLVISGFIIGAVSGYEIKGDRSLDANCLAYSKEVRDELVAEGKDAHLIGFLSGERRPGHCMVVVNPYTTNYTVIESHTGGEFKMGEPFDYELEYYLKDLLGGVPDTVWIF